MKNIHVLPTDKPSKLYFNHNKEFEKYQFSKEPFINGLTNTTNQHIYITSSDEEIKEGDWCYHPLLKGGSIIQSKFDNPNSTMKKIILTTDQYLIRDGVQAIDDEFLEWFVNNPSCEWVEVLFACRGLNGHTPIGEYRIIIPKEEPKQDLEKEMFELEQELDILSHLRWHNSKPKQETLEEFTENYINKFYNDYAFKDLLKPLLIEGANWQAERMYSEEDMKQAFFDGVRVTGEGYNGEYASGNHPDIEVEFYESYTEWFNKIKKK